MNNRLQELLIKIKQLEQELLVELQKKEKQYPRLHKRGVIETHKTII